MARLDTLEWRWASLEPSTTRYGQARAGAPLVILLHGCGGVRDHLRRYGEAAAGVGAQAVVIDSYAARGWSRAFGLAFVCTGAVLHGRERAGDVLAAAWGLLGEAHPDRPLILAGWSHGGWAAMDLMTMPVTNTGEAGVADPDPACLRNLRGLFLAYPYGGVGALSRGRPWLRAPDVLAIAPTRDHVTSARDVDRLYARARASGAHLALWRPEATHSFDEPTTAFPMRHDEALTRQSLDRFAAFVAAAFAPGAPAL